MQSERRKSKLKKKEEGKREKKIIFKENHCAKASERVKFSVFSVISETEQTWDYQGIGLYSRSYFYGLTMLVSYYYYYHFEANG